METVGFAMQVFGLAVPVAIALAMVVGYCGKRPTLRKGGETLGIALMAAVLALALYGLTVVTG